MKGCVEEQHDDHCIMNVNEEPWRIQWIHNRQMCVANAGITRVADLTKLNWDIYCGAAAAWLATESARLTERLAERQRIERDRARYAREEARRHQEWVKRDEREARKAAHQMARQMAAAAQLFASGYGPIEDLKDEVILVNLEFTDPEPILAVDCQTLHLERLMSCPS